MRIYLVRHGQTSWNLEGRAQGHQDISLDETGLAQAAKLRRAFDGVAVDRVLTSDLQRAYQTAEAVSEATKAPLVRRTELRERGFGEWEGMIFTEFVKHSLDFGLAQGVSQLEIRPPGGESFGDVWERLTPVVQEADSTEENLAIVSHGGTCALLLARFLRGNLETSRSFSFGNTAVTELERRPDGFYRMVRYADTAHLEAERPISGSLDGTSR